MHLRSRWKPLLVALVLPSLLLGACGDDDDDDASASASASEPADDDAVGASVEVTLRDYEFEDLPASVEAGTTFTVRNESESELHELVAVLLPEGEDRSVEDLLALPQEELEGLLLGGGEPAAVLVAMPGSDETIPAVGDGTLSEPGRYLIACFIPQGADPQAYLDAAAESEGGPPDVEGGPPHFVLGMHAELVVE